jgi:hypothetical protein
MTGAKSVWDIVHPATALRLLRRSDIRVTLNLTQPLT